LTYRLPRANPGDIRVGQEQAVEKHQLRHCEERFSRRGNLELIDLIESEIASLRSQRQPEDFFNSL